ncbi:MAG: PAS domain-containing protein [Ginsengibacter sp.]
MKAQLNLIHIRGSEKEVEKINEALRKDKIYFEERVVKSEKAFLKTLKEFPANIILADEITNSFTALQALVILNKRGIKIPLILVSGGENIDPILEIIKSGASDYVIIDHLEKLPDAIKSSLKKYQEDKECHEYVDKLEKAETRFRALIENTVDSVVILNTEGRVTYASPSIERVLGYTEEEALQVSIFDVVHPDDHAMIMAILPECLEKPGVSLPVMQYRCKHKNGTWVWYEGTVTNMLHDPAINGIVDNFHDITLKKIAEEELKESEERYKFLFEYSTSPKWIFDLETGKIIDVNDIAVKHYGYSREEFMSMITNDLKSPEELPRMAEIHKNLKNMEGLLRLGIFTQIKKDGTKIKAEVSGHKCFINNKHCMVIDSFDVTERENALEQLKESKEKLHAAQRIANLGYWKHDLKKQNIYWSDELYNIAGKNKKTFIPTLEAFGELIHPDDKENYYKIRKETFEGKIDNEIEYRIIGADGNIKWMHQFGKIIRDENGNPIIFEGTAQDVTTKKLLEVSLEESNLRYKMVSKATSDAIWAWDFTKSKAYWGEGFKTIFGYNLKEIAPLEDFWEQNIHPEDRDKVVKNIQEAIISTQLNWKMEYRFRKADNNYAHVLDKGFFIRDASGKATRLAGGMQDITERKELEELLDKANHLARIGSYELNIGTNILYWNSTIKDIHEVSQDFKPTVDKIKHFYHDEISKQNIKEAFDNAVNNQIPFDVEVRILTAKGNLRWVRIIGNTEGIDGKISKVYGSVQDIDERKKIVEALRLSNERYHLVTKATNDSIWDWDLLENVVVRPGKTLESALGYHDISPEEVDDFWKNHMQPEDWKRISENRNTLFKDPNENYWEGEYRFLKPDGSYAFIYDRGYITRDNEGKPIRMIGASRDITKIKESELQLKALNEKLEQRAKDLVISNQELEQFAYVASHDLQEPLRMVTNFLSQIEKKYNDILDEKGKTYIYFAVDGAKRMRQMILDLLEFSRAGRIDNTSEKVNLKLLVEDILELHQKKIEETMAKITVGELPEIAAPKAGLRRVFQNLISNSLKYSQLKNGVVPQISITSKDCNDHWQFEVKDNGIGIDAEYFEKIFVIFQRLHDKSEYSGTGIGLAITKKIIENLGGMIWVESETGSGSSFYFTISKKPIF